MDCISEIDNGIVLGFGQASQRQGQNERGDCNLEHRDQFVTERDMYGVVN